MPSESARTQWEQRHTDTLIRGIIHAAHASRLSIYALPGLAGEVDEHGCDRLSKKLQAALRKLALDNGLDAGVVDEIKKGKGGGASGIGGGGGGGGTKSKTTKAAKGSTPSPRKRAADVKNEDGTDGEGNVGRVKVKVEKGIKAKKQKVKHEEEAVGSSAGGSGSE